MQKNARTQPDGFTSWVRENITADWLMSFILNYSGETDLAVYQAADFLPAYRQCMTEAFSQGNEGYTQDLLIAMQEWGFTPEQITCPVSLWYGKRTPVPCTPGWRQNPGGTLSPRGASSVCGRRWLPALDTVTGDITGTGPRITKNRLSAGFSSYTVCVTADSDPVQCRSAWSAR